MATGDAKEVVRRVVEQCWNTGDESLAEEFYAQDFVFHGEQGQDQYGPKSIKEWMRTLRTALRDLTYEIGALYPDGEKVAMRYRVRGTQSGELQGIPPTGNSVDLTGHMILYVRDGKIVEGWGVWDRLGLLQQLGIVPPLGPPAAHEESATTR
jgi:steroid delta-isomerase-like uncharacterized protein